MLAAVSRAHLPARPRAYSLSLFICIHMSGHFTRTLRRYSASLAGW